MSLKENVDYVKKELDSEEKFLESFVKIERFYKKYKVLIIALLILIIVVPIGLFIKSNIDESNKMEANNIFEKFVKNTDDKALLEKLKQKNEKLYQVALYLQANKTNKYEKVELPIFKELLQYKQALEKKSTSTLSELSLEPDFILKDFALLNETFSYIDEKKYDKAKEVLSKIKDNPKLQELTSLLNHYLSTRN